MKKVVDGNTAAAMVAYKLSQVMPIYPITPSSPMAEYCDSLASTGIKNLFGQVPQLVEMQSEAGAAGTLHGSLCAGAMTTTFTSSQGLLLMIPNLYKLAGEHLPCVLHIAARAVASHALSIFGDHSDVMAVRQTGCLMLCSASVQQAHDFALIAHILAYKTSLPVVHFFDGFRTSHEMQKIEVLDDETIRALLPQKEIELFQRGALSSQNPYQKGTAQNPDVFFQNRERSEESYRNVYATLEQILAEFARATGRKYGVFELFGAKKPKNVIVAMGSATQTIAEVLEEDKSFSDTALLSVHLYRPFEYEKFAQILPPSVESVIVLDRTKECGARGPLFLDVQAALAKRAEVQHVAQKLDASAKLAKKPCTAAESASSAVASKRANVQHTAAEFSAAEQKNGTHVRVVGGRYGLGGKEFTPADVAAVCKNFAAMKDDFTVGIDDDVLHTNLEKVDYQEKSHQFQMKFWGLGSDGTVSASKSTIKILGEELGQYVQGYFEYDSKKSGSLTRSHIRISDKQIKSAYLVQEADIITINNFSFVHRYNCLDGLKDNGTVLLNTIFSADEVDKVLPDEYKQILQQKRAKLFVINAQKLAESVGLGNKINIIMQTALFKVANIINFADAKEKIEKYIHSTFAKKGKAVVEKNLAASHAAEKTLQQVDVKKLRPRGLHLRQREIDDQFYKRIMQPIEKLQGDQIPVSAFSKDGSVPQGTAAFEKRGFAAHLPLWLPKNCIQCGMCVLACPHNAIRPVLVKGETPQELEFAKAYGMDGYYYRLQVSPEDCTGCGVCAKNCPAMQKALEMRPADQLLEQEKQNFEKVSHLKSETQTPFSTDFPKGLQFKECLFGFSGACGGCGETPYIKLATTLFGERMIIANATGCSSIYGGSFPSCPYLKAENGRGPAWANSLFEDNAEFGLGLKIGSKFNEMQNLQKENKLNEMQGLPKENKSKKQSAIAENGSTTKQCSAKKQAAAEQAGITEPKILAEQNNSAENTDTLQQQSVWIVGGDGWAYDIGYGGLDHVLSGTENVNILVLDTEVYSNTGGQASKSTPRGAMVKFAGSGKRTKKKDLVALAIAGKNAYVAQVSLGADMGQCIKAFKEAENFDGPSLIVAYAPCTNHGIDMSETTTEMRKAVECGYWTLLRYNPKDDNLSIDSNCDFEKYDQFIGGESRFGALKELGAEEGKALLEKNKADAIARVEFLKKLAQKD